MEELQKLIKILEQNGFVWADSLAKSLNEHSLEKRLFDLIKEDPAVDEHELMYKFYGGHINRDAFKMLKSRLKQRLYNQLLILDTNDKSKLSDKTTAHLKAHLLINQAIVLEANSSPELANKLLFKAIKLSKQFENTSAIIRALTDLRSYYGMYKFDTKLYKSIESELQQYYELNEYEITAKSLFHRHMLNVRINVSTRYKNLAALEQACNELHGLWEKTGSSNIYRYYKTLYSSFLENSGNFTQLADLMSEMISLIQTNVLNKGIFNVMRCRYLLVYAYLRSSQYEVGLAEAEALKLQIPSTSSNWFAHLENYFMLAIHSGNYKKAKQLLDEVYANEAFANNTTFAQERWFLFHEFYVLITEDYTYYKTNLEFKYVSQDKNGYNVWYLIQRFLKSLKNADADQIFWNTESLRKYQAKHLGQNADKRTALFFKLLLLAGQYYDDPGLCRKKGRYLYNKLAETPIAGDAYAETEIVPYEQLWEFILGLLKSKPPVNL